MDPVILAFSVTVTVGAYGLTRRAFQTYGYAFLSPVFLSTLIVIATLVLFGLPFDRYRPGQQVMTTLLGPAVVALAVPLFRQRRVFWERPVALAAAIVGGSIVNLVTVVALARAARLEPMVVASLAPKSVTAPVAVEIAALVGGNPALTAAFVIATGTMGSMIGPWFLTRLSIRDPVARGLAAGTTAHGQGTAMMLQEGEAQGALAGVALAVTAVFTSCVAPVIIPWLLRAGP